jgi:alpha-pyrone synthase
MSLAIAGLGTALPATKITQEEAARIAQVLCGRSIELPNRLQAVYRQTGIGHRYISHGADVVRDLLEGSCHSQSVFLPQVSSQQGGPTTGQRMTLYSQTAAPLAIQAARRALVQSQLNPDEITHLVTVSCTGFFSPGVDFALIDELRLQATVQRTHIGFMGCHGAINGMRVASAFAESQAEARVLLCAVELPSLHYHFGSDLQKIVANALFGDGAAALVGMAGSADSTAWRLSATGSCILPNSAEDMSWTVGDHGFEMTLSKRVPALIARHVQIWLEEWLGRRRLELNGIRSWIVHPGGPRILTAVEETLGLTPDQMAPSRAILAECGNMSSPTILFILDRLRLQHAPRPALALAFGPGLVVEAALFE